MKTKSKVIISILVGISIVAVLFLAIMYPRIKVLYGIRRAYEEGFASELGATAKNFTEYDVTDDSLVTVDFPHFSIDLPADFENQTKEGSEIIVYRTAGTTEEHYSDCESIGFKAEGTDSTDIIILNPENIGTSEMKRLIKGYEQLGDGIPDNDYNSLKCALFREKYMEEQGKYSYHIVVFDSKDLNTGYFFSLDVENAETAYAIINSIQFHE